MDNAKLEKLNFDSLDGDQTIPHNVRSGVKAQNDFLLNNFSHAVKLGRLPEF